MLGEEEAPFSPPVMLHFESLLKHTFIDKQHLINAYYRGAGMS